MDTGVLFRTVKFKHLHLNCILYYNKYYSHALRTMRVTHSFATECNGYILVIRKDWLPVTEFLPLHIQSLVTTLIQYRRSYIYGCRRMILGHAHGIPAYQIETIPAKHYYWLPAYLFVASRHQWPKLIDTRETHIPRFGVYSFLSSVRLRYDVIAHN